MQKANQGIQYCIVLIGERIAIIIVVIVATALFFIQGSHPAYSAPQKVPISDSLNITGVMYKSQSSEKVIQVSPSPIPTMTPTPSLVPSPTATPISQPTIDANTDAIWDQIAACESNGNWSDNTGNGYYGGLQFSQGAWNSVGGFGLPSDASREDQITKAKLLQSRRGWGVWGGCAKKLGLD